MTCIIARGGWQRLPVIFIDIKLPRLAALAVSTTTSATPGRWVRRGEVVEHNWWLSHQHVPEGAPAFTLFTYPFTATFSPGIINKMPRGGRKQWCRGGSGGVDKATAGKKKQQLVEGGEEAPCQNKHIVGGQGLKKVLSARGYTSSHINSHFDRSMWQLVKKGSLVQISSIGV